MHALNPVRHPGVCVFTTPPTGSTIDPDRVVAYIRGPEAVSVVVAEADALGQGLPILFRAAWLTLAVQSDLAAAGLTAAFSAALDKRASVATLLPGSTMTICSRLTSKRTRS